MVYLKFNFLLFVNLLSFFQVSLLETVHFTNSRNKILRANNFTTYKVEVPNGEPITIIEANTPLINKNIKFNEVENTQYPINQNQDNRNHVMDLKTSLSMTVTPHNNKEEYENLPAGEEESVTNDYSSNLSPEHIHHQHTMKTVYSPELLQKFLKDYANKVQSSELANQESIQSTGQDEMRDKYESIEAEKDGQMEDDDGNRRVSSANEEHEPTQSSDVQERKHYRPGGGSSSNNFHHPYNKNNGWVTLEAIPWSKSKVSKWQSSVKPYSNQNSYNYQGSNSNNHNNNNNGNNNVYNRPSRPPPYNFEEDNDDDEYYNQKPQRPSYQNNHFYGAGSSSSSSHIRPPSDSSYPPQSSHSSSHHHSSSSSFNGNNNNNNNNNNYDNDYRPNRPYQPEIITDNRPSNFPNQQEPPSSYGQNDYSHNRPQYDNRPDSRPDTRPDNRPDHRPSRPQNDYQYSGSQNYNHYSNKDGPHPLSYPTAGGDGEWVLVSTTKGYQFPKRNGQRAMLFQAQNGVAGTDTRKNDNKGIITAASHQYEASVSIRPPYQAGPTKTSMQQVKLSVLPLFTKNENRPHQSHHQHHNNMEVNVYKPSGYNGIIETEPSSQTVEESVAAAANANKVNSITASAQKLPKKKRKYMKNYAVMRKTPASDSTAVLAAVSF